MENEFNVLIHEANKGMMHPIDNVNVILDAMGKGWASQQVLVLRSANRA